MEIQESIRAWGDNLFCFGKDTTCKQIFNYHIRSCLIVQALCEAGSSGLEKSLYSASSRPSAIMYSSHESLINANSPWSFSCSNVQLATRGLRWNSSTFVSLLKSMSLNNFTWNSCKLSLSSWDEVVAFIRSSVFERFVFRLLAHLLFPPRSPHDFLLLSTVLQLHKKQMNFFSSAFLRHCFHQNQHQSTLVLDVLRKVRVLEKPGFPPKKLLWPMASCNLFANLQPLKQQTIF